MIMICHLTQTGINISPPVSSPLSTEYSGIYRCCSPHNCQASIKAGWGRAEAGGARAKRSKQKASSRVATRVFALFNTKRDWESMISLFTFIFHFSFFTFHFSLFTFHFSLSYPSLIQTELSRLLLGTRCTKPT